MREVMRFVLFVNVAPMKSHELRKFHEIFVYSIGATFSNKTNLVTSGTPLFTIFEIVKIQSNLGLDHSIESSVASQSKYIGNMFW